MHRQGEEGCCGHVVLAEIRSQEWDVVVLPLQTRCGSRQKDHPEAESRDHVTLMDHQELRETSKPPIQIDGLPSSHRIGYNI